MGVSGAEFWCWCMEPGRKTRSSVESVQSENSEPTHPGDTTVLRDRQSKRLGERRTRKRGAMEVKGAEVSERTASRAAGECANRRTEENRLDSKTSAEAEARSRAVMEWEEEGETTQWVPVTLCGGGRARCFLKLIFRERKGNPPLCLYTQGSSKLEKAEVLQMTVDHLKMLHATGGAGTDALLLRDHLQPGFRGWALGIH